MKKTLINLAIISIALISCKKESVQETPQATTGNIPTIAITEPDDNFTVNIGSNFNLEGVANDSEALTNIHYSITSPNASYNYEDSHDFLISGTSKDFNYQIPIPENASVGNANLKVYASDSDNNQSLIVSRDFLIKDTINPIINQYIDTIHTNDSIIVTVFRNSNNVVDSLEIFNYTTSQTIANVSDIGGFKVLNLLSLNNGINPNTTTASENNLTESNTNIFSFKIPSIGAINSLYEDELLISFLEFDTNIFNLYPVTNQNIRIPYVQ